MAKYKSQYLELGFYVNGERKQFSGGKYATYATEDKSEIEVLDKLSDATKIKEEKPAVKPKPASKK
jgi:outer membrane protease